MAGCARNVVLLGDAAQLPAPARGAHPAAGGGASCLDWYGGGSSVAADRGVFLPTSRRLHPKLCAAISELVYEGRLTSHATAADRSLPGAMPGDLVGAAAGLAVVDVRPADGADDGGAGANANAREAAAVARVVAELLAHRTLAPVGRALTVDDVLVVAPFAPAR